MATQLYEAFLERPDKEVAVLVEVTPKEVLRDWTLVSGRTNTYSREFSNYAGTEVIQGGIYRKLTGVGIGTGIAGATNTTVQVVNLAMTNSIAAVEATQSSWYYDEQPLGATSTLYVHSPTAASPDTFDSSAIAKFRIHFSTVPKTFEGIYYDPRITPDSLPDVHEETEDLFFGPIKKVSQGEVGINNADALFDKLSNNWAWKNAEVKLYVGGDELNHIPGGGTTQVVNHLPRSEELNAPLWTTENCTSVGNQRADEDGNVILEKIVDDSTASVRHGVYQGVGIGQQGSQYVISATVAAAEYTWCFIADRGDGGTWHRLWVNLSTGAIGTKENVDWSFIEDLGNGLHRCTFAFTRASVNLSVQPSVYTATGDGVGTHNGDGSSGIYAGKVQLQRIAEYDARYVTTGAAAVFEAFSSDYETIGTFEVEDISPRVDETTLFVRDRQKQTFRKLPIRPMQRGSKAQLKFPNLPQESEGILLPIIYGDCKSVKCHKANFLAQGRNYYFADRKYQTVYDIVKVYDDGVEVPEGGNGWGPGGNLQACTFGIGANYGLTVGTVTADVIGKPVQGKPWETSTDYLKYYGEIVADIYTTFLGVSDDDIDSAACKEVDEIAPHPQCLVIEGDDIRSRKSARAFIRELEVGVMGRTIKTLDGKIKPTIWSPGFDNVSSKTIEDPDIVEFDPDPTIETMFSKVFVYGDPRKGDGSWGLIQDEEDLETRFVYLDGRSEERSIFTNLTAESSANDLAGKVLALSKQPDLNVRIVETGIRLMNQTVGDRLLVTFNRAPHRTGEWQGVPVEIISITKRFAPVPQVEMVVNNLRGTGDFVGMWTENGVSAFSSATELEKAVSGYWSDPDGLVDSSDMDTKNKSTWW